MPATILHSGQSQSVQSILQQHYPVAQNKPKVSSPAPSKIYGRPEHPSIISLDKGPTISSHQNQFRNGGYVDQHAKSSASQKWDLPSPPPAHTHSRYVHIRDSAFASQSLVPGKIDSDKNAIPAKPQIYNPIRDYHHSTLRYKEKEKPCNVNGTSPPIAVSAPSRAHDIHLPPQAASGSIPINNTIYVQSKPLDLGISDRHRDSLERNSSSPKRKVAANEPIGLDIKKKRCTSPANIYEQDASLIVPNSNSMQNDAIPLQLTRSPTHSLQPIPHPIAAALPKVAAAQVSPISPVAVTISSKTIIVNATESNSFTANSMKPSESQVFRNKTPTPSNPTQGDNKVIEIDINTSNTNNNKPNVSITVNNLSQNGSENEAKNTIANLSTFTQSASASYNPLRTSSADGLLRSSSTNSSPSPSPNSAQSAPATPAKLPSECEKSSSQSKWRT